MAVLALLAAVTTCVARIGLSNKTSNAWTKGGGRRSHPPPGPQAPGYSYQQDENPHGVRAWLVSGTLPLPLEALGHDQPGDSQFTVGLTHVLSPTAQLMPTS